MKNQVALGLAIVGLVSVVLGALSSNVIGAGPFMMVGVLGIGTSWSVLPTEVNYAGLA